MYSFISQLNSLNERLDIRYILSMHADRAKNINSKQNQESAQNTGISNKNQFRNFCDDSWLRINLHCTPPYITLDYTY